MKPITASDISRKNNFLIIDKQAIRIDLILSFSIDNSGDIEILASTGCDNYDDIDIECEPGHGAQVFDAILNEVTFGPTVRAKEATK